MEESFDFEGYTVTKLVMEEVIHFEVYNGIDYVCRLVPGLAGFQPSKLDIALEPDLPTGMLVRLSDYIVTKES